MAIELFIGNYIILFDDSILQKRVVNANEAKLNASLTLIAWHETDQSPEVSATFSRI